MTSPPVPEKLIVIDGADKLADKLDKNLSLWDPEEILERLSKLPCPMNWEVDKYFTSGVTNELCAVKLHDLVDGLNETPRYSLTMVMGQILFASLTFFRLQKYEEGLKFLLEFAEHNKFIDEVEGSPWKHYTDDAYCIYYATLSWFYFKLHSRDSCLEYLCMAEKKFSSDKDIFYFYAKAKLLRSLSREGKKAALLIMDKLLIMEDNPAFHSFAGSLMGEIRHFSFPFSCPTPEELEHCEKAYRYDSSVEFYSRTLLRCYRDLYCRTDGPAKQNYLQKAKDLNWKMLSEGCDNLFATTTARLLFFSLSYGPVEYSDVLDKAAKKALSKRPNNTIVNDYISRFYLHFKMYEKALPCLETAAKKLPYLVGMLLYIKKKLNHMDNFEILISEYLEYYSKEEDLYNFYGGIAEFYMLSVKNFEKCYYFVKMCSCGPPEKYRLSITSYHVSFLEVFLQLFDNTKSESSDAIQKADLLLKEISINKNFKFSCHSMSKIVSYLI